jgi:hypothetical protein
LRHVVPGFLLWPTGWCPIKHARRVLGPHPYYQGFADFSDAEGFRGKLKQMKGGVKIEGIS